MADPSNAELAELIRNLTTSVGDIKTTVTDLQVTVTTLQSKVDTLQPKTDDDSSSHTSGSGDHRNERPPPKFQKLDFPKFDGKSDPLAFINRCESYFRQQRIAAEEQVWMAGYNLQDTAQLWFIQLQQDEGTPPWRRFTELLNLRFGPPLRANPLGELVACRRTGSVVDYQDRFEALLPRAGPLLESQKVQIFTAGLLPPLCLDVEIHNPQSLAVAMSLARKLELRDQCAVQAVPAPSSARGMGILPAPTPRPALPAPPPAGAAQQQLTLEGRPVRRLS